MKKKNYYIKPSGKKVYFIPDEVLEVELYEEEGISEVYFEDSAYILSCFGNNIKKISITGDLNMLWCQDNQLEELCIAEGISAILCERNKIKAFTVPLSAFSVHCDMMDGIEGQNRKDLRMTIYQKR